MKFNFLNKNNFFRTGLISLSLAFIFFLISIFSLSFTDYKLSNYSKELKERFNIEYDTFFNFDYWFASQYVSTQNNISTNKLDKLIVQSPNTYVSLYTDHGENNKDFFYSYEVRKSNSISIDNLVEYKYLPNTKTGILTINDSSSNIYDSYLQVQIPASFKGTTIVQGFKENISTDNTKITIQEPKSSNKDKK